MSKFIKDIMNDQYFVIAFYIALLIIIIILLSKFLNSIKGNFGEARIFRYLKKLYNKEDYPYLKQIILPVNKDTYAYYDAIVFGDKYAYIIEIKNHAGSMIVDTLNDWVFTNSKGHKINITNPFFENEVKANILCQFLKYSPDRIVEIVVLNKNCIPLGNKGSNLMIEYNRLNSLIMYCEKNSDLKMINPRIIEKKGNYLLDVSLKNPLKRRKIINKLKHQRVKN